MLNNNQSNNDLFGIEVNPNLGTPLYQSFSNSGQTWQIILPATLLFIISIISIILNLFVIIITILTLTLRGSANYLMALICFCEVLHASGHFIFFIIAITGINFIPLLAANLLMIHMLFAINMTIPLMLSASVDRLFAVAAPNLHKKVYIEHKRIYLSIHTSVCLIFGLYGVYFITAFSIKNPNIPTTACLSEILSGDVGNEYFIFCAIFNFLTAFCYFLIWAIIRLSEETNTRLLRSLVCIMFISIGGYIINLSVYHIFFYINDNKIFNAIFLWQLGFIPGILLNIGAGSNAVILYFTSSEYRKAFKHNLNKMAKVCGIIKGTNTITVVSPMFATSSQKLSKIGNNY